MNDWSESIILLNTYLNQIKHLLNDKNYEDAKILSYDLSHCVDILSKTIDLNINHNTYNII